MFVKQFSYVFLLVPQRKQEQFIFQLNNMQSHEEPASPAEELLDKQFIAEDQFNQRIEKISFLPQNPIQIFPSIKPFQKLDHFTIVTTPQSSQLWAIRTLQKSDEQALKNAKTQCAIVSMHQNPRIVKYHSSYLHDNKIYIMKEYTNQDELTSFIARYKQKIPQNLCAFILKEVLLGLKTLHQHKQIHRDIKSDNILINKNGSIKIGGFQYAIQLTKTQKKSKSVVGTPAWMAPQLIKKQPYSEQVDIWSFGILAVELAQGEPPFLKLPSLKAMYFTSTKDAYRLNKLKFSLSFCDFVQKCLEKDRTKRYSASQLLEHQFIKQIGQGQKERELFQEMINSKPSDS